MQLILASASKGRKKILKSLGLDFKVIPSHIDESKISATNPKLLVQKIAKAKAEKVFEKFKNQQRSNPVKLRHGTGMATQRPNYLIIAADSVAVLNNQVIGKPKNNQEAKKILKQLSGKTHSFITGLYAINTKTNKTWQKFTESKVTFRKLKNWEIDAYLKRFNTSFYAGGYTLTHSQDFVTRVEGSITNVLGLPLEILLPVLRENDLKV